MIEEFTSTISIPIAEQLPRFRTKKIQLVLIGGRAGVGKTTAAQELCGRLLKYDGLQVVHTAFANPIKDIAREIFHWDGNKDEKGRRLLQVIGTDAGREYNENIWIEYLENRLLNMFPPHFVLVDDWRFPNEKEYFEGDPLFDLTTIRIENSRSNIPENVSSHASENSLPNGVFEDLTKSIEHTWSDGNISDAMYDFVVFNDGTLEEFYKKLGSVVSYLQTKIITY